VSHGRITTLLSLGKWQAGWSAGWSPPLLRKTKHRLLLTRSLELPMRLLQDVSPSPAKRPTEWDPVVNLTLVINL